MKTCRYDEGPIGGAADFHSVNQQLSAKAGVEQQKCEASARPAAQRNAHLDPRFISCLLSTRFINGINSILFDHIRNVQIPMFNLMPKLFFFFLNLQVQILS